MMEQLIRGTIVLGLCSGLHILIIIYWVDWLHTLNLRIMHHAAGIRQAILITTTFGITLLGHILQVWIWAIALVLGKATSSMEDAVYFAIVTYTTVGYGDLTLAAEHRIFGAMASVTGLFTFGLSTAVQVNLLSKIFGDPDLS